MAQRRLTGGSAEDEQAQLASSSSKTMLSTMGAPSLGASSPSSPWRRPALPLGAVSAASDIQAAWRWHIADRKGDESQERGGEKTSRSTLQDRRTASWLKQSLQVGLRSRLQPSVPSHGRAAAAELPWRRYLILLLLLVAAEALLARTTTWPFFSSKPHFSWLQSPLQGTSRLPPTWPPQPSSKTPPMPPPAPPIVRNEKDLLRVGPIQSRLALPQTSSPPPNLTTMPHPPSTTVSLHIASAPQAHHRNSTEALAPSSPPLPLPPPRTDLSQLDSTVVSPPNFSHVRTSPLLSPPAAPLPIPPPSPPPTAPLPSPPPSPLSPPPPPPLQPPPPPPVPSFPPSPPPPSAPPPLMPPHVPPPLMPPLAPPHILSAADLFSSWAWLGLVAFPLLACIACAEHFLDATKDVTERYDEEEARASGDHKTSAAAHTAVSASGRPSRWQLLKSSWTEGWRSLRGRRGWLRLIGDDDNHDGEQDTGLDRKFGTTFLAEVGRLSPSNGASQSSPFLTGLWDDASRGSAGDGDEGDGEGAVMMQLNPEEKMREALASIKEVDPPRTGQEGTGRTRRSAVQAPGRSRSAEHPYLWLWVRHTKAIRLNGLVPLTERERCRDDLALTLLVRNHGRHVTTLVRLYRHYASVNSARTSAALSSAAARGDTCVIDMRRAGWRQFCRRLGCASLDETISAATFDLVHRSRDPLAIPPLPPSPTKLGPVGRVGRVVAQTFAQYRRPSAPMSPRSSASSSLFTSLSSSAPYAPPSVIPPPDNDGASSTLDGGAAATAFGLSEFIEGVFRLACVHAAYLDNPDLEIARRALATASGHVMESLAAPLGPMACQAAVVAFLDDFVQPHAASLGLATDGFRSELAAAHPSLGNLLSRLTPLHARLFERFAAASSWDQQQQMSTMTKTKNRTTATADDQPRGVGLAAFLELASFVVPPHLLLLIRPRVRHVFAQGLPIAAAFRSGAGWAHPRLPPPAFQEVLVRLGLLLIDPTLVTALSSDSSGTAALTLPSCPWGIAVPALSALGESDVAALGAALREMRTALSTAPSPSRVLRGSSSTGREAAAVRIQRIQRGRTARSRLRHSFESLKDMAATTIQAHWRGFSERGSLRLALLKVDAAFASAVKTACGPELASESVVLTSAHPLGFGRPLPDGHAAQWHARSKVRQLKISSLVVENQFLKPVSPTASSTTGSVASSSEVTVRGSFEMMSNSASATIEEGDQWKPPGTESAMKLRIQ